MLPMKETTNPKGKHGKPITLAPMTFDEAARKMLGTQPPKSEEKPARPEKKATKRKP